MKLSIITINWNNASGLRQSIESVIHQLNSDCEYIIVDGESMDESLEIIKRHEDKITKWVSIPNKGIYGSMNIGITLAQGEYCLFLNSGDWLIENGLEKAVEECTGEDIIYFNTILSYNNVRFQEHKYSPNLTMRNFYRQTIGHQSTLIKTRLFKMYGLYNENNKIHSDYEFWIKTIILKNCSCKYVDSFISYYDMGGRSSKPNPESTKEINTILSLNFPARVLADYKYWQHWQQEMEVMAWYRRQPLLYLFLHLLYRIIKNIRRLLGLKY